MLINEKVHEFEIDGRKCNFKTGKLALKSQSSVWAQMGDTVITVNVNTAPARSDSDFFPLSVEYLEKFYASGKISGSRFVKRERFPSDDAVLKARMIDRALRSRFPADYRDEVNLIVTVMSYDEQNDPLILAINAASVALMNSTAPFDGPVAGVRVGLDENGLRNIPESMDETSEKDQMNYVVAGDGEKFTMIDAGCHEVPEEKVLDGMRMALNLMNPWLEAQNTFMSQLEKKDKAYTSFDIPEELVSEMKEFLTEEVVKEALQKQDKIYHSELQNKVAEHFEGQYAKNILMEAYDKLQKKALRKIVKEEGVRVDGRSFEDIRELYTEVDLLPRVHGSALFTRGKTQTLTTATLGSLKDAQLVDDMLGDSEKRYMHFYNDLPFVYGEAGRIKLVPSRRAIGHGMLAEKALQPVIPSAEEFPYTIVVMSEIQGENGSSSMASSCGSTMALMAAGVPIKRPVAGVACGLVTNEDGTFNVLTDMQGVEDFYGDMDFKVTGTSEGVTAVQMDNKIGGLTIEMCEQAFAQCKTARSTILEAMSSSINATRETISQYAPKVAQEKIPVDKIGELIGPGGKNIREITETTGAELNVDEDGTVNIYAEKQDQIDAVLKILEQFNFKAEVGKIYKGKVASVMNYGGFVDLVPGVAGLVHVSELSDGFVKDVNEFIKEGQEVNVKVVGIDDQGKIKLTMKGIKQEEEQS
jgi:polyribonucleotide nucleotidyltransferase